MKAKNFVIKVGDLLQEGGKSDLMKFEKQFPEEITNINDQGISGEIEFKSLNQDSLLVNLKNLNCEINESCDRCSENYVRKVEIEEYSSRFVASEKIKNEEEESSEEEIFVINTKDETVDLEPMFIQAIKLEEPFVKLCKKCNKEVEKLSESGEDEESLISGGNVFFH